MLEALRLSPHIRARIEAGPLGPYLVPYVTLLRNEGYARSAVCQANETRRPRLQVPRLLRLCALWSSSLPHGLENLPLAGPADRAAGHCQRQAPDPTRLSSYLRCAAPARLVSRRRRHSRPPAGAVGLSGSRATAGDLLVPDGACRASPAC